MLNIYRIERRNPANYDEFDSAVVIAESETEASQIHPDGSINVGEDSAWPHPEDVIVTLIGVAKEDSKSSVVVASFNAG